MSQLPRLAPGVTFGSFQIVEPLGRGGMATVWKAYEPTLDRYVALKVLPAEFLHEENFAARFQREARVVAKLEHPHIVPIFAFGIESDIPWMSMRLIGGSLGGGSLASILAQGRIVPLARAVEILRAVAEALTYAHGLGVMHRDVKPQNILLDEFGRVYLADFGIARMVEGEAPLTRTGMVSGTPQYMAPEHALGTPLDHRVDIYALGIVAYEMFTGTTPFSADTPVAILFKQVQAPIPVPPTAFVPEPLFGALLRSLAKDPQDRWPSAVDFVAALERGLEEMATPAPDESAPPLAPARRSPWLAVAVLATLIAVGLVGLWAFAGRGSTAQTISSSPPTIGSSTNPIAAPAPPVEAAAADAREDPPRIAQPIAKPTGKAATAPPSVASPPADIGTPWELGRRIPIAASAGPVSAEFVRFKVLPKGDLEVQLEVRCAKGHDQSLNWEVVVLGEAGEPLAKVEGEEGIDEGDQATMRKKQKLAPGLLAAARGFRVRLRSADD